MASNDVSGVGDSAQAVPAEDQEEKKEKEDEDEEGCMHMIEIRQPKLFRQKKKEKQEKEDGCMHMTVRNIYTYEGRSHCPRKMSLRAMPLPTRPRPPWRCVYLSETDDEPSPSSPSP
jgi:hypothetical protein